MTNTYKMNGTLLVDFYKTAIDGKRWDNTLSKYGDGLTTKDKEFYEVAGENVYRELRKGSKDLEEEVKDGFFGGIDNLVQDAVRSDLEVLVYSSGNQKAIRKAFALKGLKVETVDPNKVGDKKQKDSYLNILQQYSASKDTIVYATDSDKEVKAAVDAGFKYVIHTEPAKNIYKVYIDGKLVKEGKGSYEAVHEAIEEIEKEARKEEAQEEGKQSEESEQAEQSESEQSKSEQSESEQSESEGDSNE